MGKMPQIRRVGNEIRIHSITSIRENLVIPVRWHTDQAKECRRDGSYRHWCRCGHHTRTRGYNTLTLERSLGSRFEHHPNSRVLFNYRFQFSIHVDL